MDYDDYGTPQRGLRQTIELRLDYEDLGHHKGAAPDSRAQIYVGYEDLGTPQEELRQTVALRSIWIIGRFKGSAPEEMQKRKCNGAGAAEEGGGRGEG